MKDAMSDPLVRSAVGNAVRYAIATLFGFFGLDKVVQGAQQAALIEVLQGLGVVAVGLAISLAWNWLNNFKLLNTQPPPPRKKKGNRS